ncbi:MULTISPECIES: hypothetical protein [unclassified Mesorhizobium]|uniref:hypothetical protein n=1 Tax=unclassified Mesorhizobium TaxID=325217 RepID=UPI000FD835E5|nr:MULTISPECIES: hypothetical protein [unclassified Mesorhizobium]TGQ31436.1 hypothetical protein EN859_029815 [Mesorhizobium sp. M00.F.Ca.ET.216.01.1.1]TIS55501.1 MAG: hypothetical protein E5W91_21630 [Mesorhizobium sp.]TIS85783.1 MAG: hypothetical protein E5W89_31760 [Mesorhizobium sp.]TJW05335.1 MAG: hypothetical protein E5W82_29850 [Mesorhizobium sp.]TJW36057.1 MAG: hypothetical protein E5W83_34035 [Mesorhizobium sp.]
MNTLRNTVEFGKTPETIPNGPGAAAILAAGIGCAAIGVLAFASELSPGLHDLLNFYNPVGPLSGKTTVAIIVWLVAWYGLSRIWRRETVNMRTVNIAALVLLGIGFLLTFPPFWYLFV